MEQNNSYDYIITGAGCAGLSLLVHMISSGKFGDKKILLVDKDAKNKNDRTWCFWESSDGLFQPIVYKEWEQLLFFSTLVSKSLEIAPYKYKLIKGYDFYQHCLDQIKQHPSIHFLQATVDDVFGNENETGIIAKGKKYFSQYIFNSILFEKPELKENQYWLLQHFKGWFIKTEQPAFDPSVATLMDFRTSQHEGTSFFYVLPFSKTEALVEYTLFSPNILSEELYETALKNYIEKELQVSNYEISEKEFGVIPMTNYAFPAQKNNIINIGTVGGQTKGSSGYTFKFIQKNSANIVKSLVAEGHPFAVKKWSNRFQFYDSVLLNILYNKTLGGAEIFSDLFKKNKAHKVLKFLDNETDLPEEINIISTLPTIPFTKAAIRQIFKPVG